MELFIQRFFRALAPKSRVLDLGAGDGTQSKALADDGHAVVAVDRRAATFTHPLIVRYEADIKEWIAANDETEAYDAILIRNVIIFFEAEYVHEMLMPAMRRMLKPGGVIAIEAFPRDPEPPFSPNRLSSYWRSSDLQPLFPGWEVLEAAEFDGLREDLSGRTRLFYMSQLMVRKP